MPIDEKFINFVSFCDLKYREIKFDISNKIDIKSKTDSLFLGIFGF